MDLLNLIKKAVDEEVIAMAYGITNQHSLGLGYSEVYAVVARLEHEGYKKEKINNEFVVMKDPNHALSENVQKTNESVRTTNQSIIDTNKSIVDTNEKLVKANDNLKDANDRSFWLTLIVTVLTFINVLFLALDYFKTPDITKSELQEVIAPLVKEVKDLRELHKTPPVQKVVDTVRNPK